MYRTYRNLEAELSRYGIARKDIAAVLELNVNTVSEKLSNPDRLKLKEAQTIRRTFSLSSLWNTYSTTAS